MNSVPSALNSPSLAFLFTAFLSSASWALGLGEIVVQSSLGKPLRASIKVLGAPKDIQPECFELHRGKEAPLPGAADARFRLETRNGETTLYLTTAQAVNDPVLQITVSAGCADRLQREYMVFLDPPSAFEPAAALSDTLPPNAEPQRLERKLTRAPRAQKTPVSIKTAHRSTRSTSGKSKVAAPSVRPLLTKPVGSQLVLSGGRERAGKPKPAETVALGSGQPDLSRLLPPTRADLTQLSDDQTSLNHRIAYLQAQLASLEKRNNELEAARGVLAKPPTPPPVPVRVPDEATPWSQFLIGLGLLGGSVALFFGLRSFSRPSKASTKRSQWSDSLSVTTVGGFSLLNPISELSPSTDTIGPSPDFGGPAVPTYRTPINTDFPDLAEETKSSPPRSPVSLPVSDFAPMGQGVPDPLAPVPVAGMRHTQPIPVLDSTASVSQAPSSPPVLMQQNLLDPEWPIAKATELSIPVLQQRLQEAPTVSPIPWLQLLDLLARADMETEYVAARSECQSLFNVNLTEPSAVSYTPGQASLEAYPHVVAQLQTVWNTPDADDFLSNLVYDQRGGLRQGFDLGAYREILLLHSLAEASTSPN